VVELDLHINDPEFADSAARKLLELMKAAPVRGAAPGGKC